MTLLFIIGMVLAIFLLSSNTKKKPKAIRRKKPLDKKPKPKTKAKPKVEIIEPDLLKAKGDLYEKFIGQAFEQKGELVIYNGFIHGYADRGVDVISICLKRKTIDLIQCKHWSYKQMFIEDIEAIHRKLSQFELEHITHDIRAIKTHLQKKKNLAEIEAILAKDKTKFSVRKTLYMSSQKVIDLNIGKKLKQIKPNIFQYSDMKIVILDII
jgi:hypothetical protein